ncbi:hypothetical protein BDV96DRAFT_328981 [Lophiotrema nucula]|uniref:SWI5-dependent HO expression protein 3 n=1 Tax=Lophiotrema nucula TaxID=690887 RepID=A0A6A5YKF9_9PLEO|nr:hypothetical protein BDV96DRAFT_328981 [Lophiotrema nucula]
MRRFFSSNFSKDETSSPTREEKTSRPRALSLSPFRKRKKPPPSKSTPLLPPVAFDYPTSPTENDMNASAWSYEDALRNARALQNSRPPPPAMPLYTAPRNVSGPLAVDTAVGTPDPSSTTSPWQRSNPHAAPHNSKTSQYIDKITQENERLRRELKAEKAARDEEAKRWSAAQSKAADSRAEYQHLQLLADANARTIERKDRKLEELKAAVETEAKRRRAAEQRAEEALKMLGDTRSETQRQLAAAYEQKHLAETNADAARDGYKRITDGYDKKMKSITDELKQLRHQRLEDADKIRRQAIVSEQLQHELARKQRTEDKMVDVMGTYKREHRKEVDNLVREAEQMRNVLPSKEKEATVLVTSLAETRDKMKWVMAQKTRQEGSGGGRG